MPKVTVYNQQGENVGSLTLKADIFDCEVNEQVVYDAVRLSQANSRQDTSKTKKRDEVSGGGKKPYRQKGTGNARQGSTRAPQWRHGGIVFGPTGNQNHTLKQNKKERVLALKSVLTCKAKEKEIFVVDELKLEKPSTKSMCTLLNTIKANKPLLVVIREESVNDEAVYSLCNVKDLYGIQYFDELNVYDALNCGALVFTKEAMKELEEVL